MDLTTKYLGLTLAHPLMPGASPLCDTLDSCKRLEDAGAAALVLRSLFEEQITRDEMGAVHDLLVDEASDADAIQNFPEPSEFALTPDAYLEHLRRVKSAVGVPVIASPVGPLPDLVGDAGVMAPLDAPDAWADALEACLDDDRAKDWASAASAGRCRSPGRPPPRRPSAPIAPRSPHARSAHDAVAPFREGRSMRVSIDARELTGQPT